MKLNSKRIDFEYTPGEEIFTFPEDTGLPFMFDVDEELTSGGKISRKSKGSYKSSFGE